jgi:hypothetical protein
MQKRLNTPGRRPVFRNVACASAVLAFGAAISACPEPARAESLPPIEASVNTYVSWLPRMPSVTFGGADTWLREVPSAEAKYKSQGLFWGLGGDMAIAWNDRWLIPVLGFEFALAVGSSPRVLVSADGTIVELRPWTAIRTTFLGPGFGVRGKQRRWMWSAFLQTGASYLMMKAQVAAGTEAVSAEAGRWSPVLRAVAEVCRRLDPVTRACVFAAPHAYDFGWANGISGGLRWEFGP